MRSKIQVGQKKLREIVKQRFNSEELELEKSLPRYTAPCISLKEIRSQNKDYRWTHNGQIYTNLPPEKVLSLYNWENLQRRNKELVWEEIHFTTENNSWEDYTARMQSYGLKNAAIRAFILHNPFHARILAEAFNLSFLLMNICQPAGSEIIISSLFFEKLFNAVEGNKVALFVMHVTPEEDSVNPKEKYILCQLPRRF